MAEITLRRLQHAQVEVAEEIFQVMQAAYRVEAELLGVSDFAPLRRTVEHIARSTSAFLGATLDQTIVAVAEIEAEPDGGACIAALVTHPAYFRRGYALMVMREIVQSAKGPLSVSTGILNAPAIRLYERLGFGAPRRWRTDCGIEMVTLRWAPSAADNLPR